MDKTHRHKQKPPKLEQSFQNKYKNVQRIWAPPATKRHDPYKIAHFSTIEKKNRESTSCSTQIQIKPLSRLGTSCDSELSEYGTPRDKNFGESSELL